MFTDCRSLVEAPGGLVSLVHAEEMFLDCTSLSVLPEGFSLPMLENGYGMFQNCKLLLDVPDTINLAKLYDGRKMFGNCTLTAQSVKNVLYSLPQTTDWFCSIGIGHTKYWAMDEEIADFLNTGVPIKGPYRDAKNGWTVVVEA